VCLLDWDGITLQSLTVEIVRATTRKRFLGGYRSKLTGMEYHHGEAQTVKPGKPDYDPRSRLATRYAATDQF